MHEPSRVDFEITHKEICDIFGLVRGSYENRFFKDIKYLSDSGGRWREGHFNEWVNVENKLHINTSVVVFKKVSPRKLLEKNIF